MSDWLPTDAIEWNGRPVARRVADAAARQRASLRGVVRGVVPRRAHPVRGGRARTVRQDPGTVLDAWIDDGTASITLRWLGREASAGVVPGAMLEVEGTVSPQRGRLVILNPLYRFVGPGTKASSSCDASAAPADFGGTGDVQAETSTSW